MKPTPVELRRVKAEGTTFFRACLRGTSLETQTFRAGGKPRISRKSFATSAAAHNALEKAVQSRMREGFVDLRDDPGQGFAVLFRAATPHGGNQFDLARDGAQLVAGGMKTGARGVVIRAYDLRTGAQSDLVDIDAEGRKQTFLHALWLDASAEHIVYALNGRTIRRHLASGREIDLAAYDQDRNARFNPFVVAPAFDAARERLVVFDRDDQVRVLNGTWRSIFTCRANTATTEVQTAALSPSGRRLALFVASRYLIYSHADAAHDTTQEIRVYDVDSGRLLHTHPCTEPIDDIEISPDDRTLLEWRNYGEGPVLVNLATRRELWRFAKSDDPTQLRESWVAAYSPDRRWLAIGADTVHLLNARTRLEQSLPQPFPYQHGKHIVWSADSTRLALAAQGVVSVLRI